jgi:glycosyltransferase involved in cell wall biosynthesis
VSVTSIVLPVYNQADHIGRIVEGHISALAGMLDRYELILVTNACRDASPEVCSNLAERHEAVRHVALGPAGGWGLAVKAGLRAAAGERLCYTNSARTSPEMLAVTLAYALAYPDVVVKANRRLRDDWRRRFGSLIYNLECRLLFDLAWWDVNGTPKVFSRTYQRLLDLEHDDDLIDAEFSMVCRREGYPLVEVPLRETTRHSGKSTTNYRSAIRMYAGAYRLWRSGRQS